MSKSIAIWVPLLLFGVTSLWATPDFFFDELSKTRDNTWEKALEIHADFEPAKANCGQSLWLVITGRLKPGFHLYSAKLQIKDGPMPTSILINPSKLKFTEKLAESRPKTLFDQTYHTKLEVHKQEFWIKRSLKVPISSIKGDLSVSGNLWYQLCDNKLCMPPKMQPFSLKLPLDCS